MTLSIDTADVPSFDISDPFFSASSAAVAAAREQSWWARTNFGLAVLRYDEVSALLKDRRLRQGSFAWPAQNGIEQGLLSEWWAEIMLSKEGDDHRRLRKLANPAFSRTLIERMGPEFRALADELIDAYAAAGSCEFVSQFAEPYAARVLCKLIGMDEARWHDLSRWSTDLGLSFGVTIREHQGRIEDALQNLYAVSEELIADRRVRPRDDVVSSLVQAHDAEEGSLSDIELLAMVSLIVFGGMDTTKNQLGLAMQLFVEHPDQCALLAERPELARKRGRGADPLEPDGDVGDAAHHRGHGVRRTGAARGHDAAPAVVPGQHRPAGGGRGRAVRHHGRAAAALRVRRRRAPLHRALAGADRHARGAAADRAPDAEPALHRRSRWCGR